MEKYLSKLIIEKYEKSTSYTKGKESGNLSFDVYENHKDIIENPKKKKEFNELVMKLSKEGLIKIKWIDVNNIVDRISFNVKDIDKFYEMGNIEKKDLLIEKTLTDLENTKINIQQPWIVEYLDALKSEVKAKKKVPKVIEEKGEKLYNALIGVDEVISNEETMLERLFSKKYLKNSKVFSKTMRSTITKIIKKHCKELPRDLEEEEILEFVGIEKTNNDLYLKGNIKIKLKNEILDLGKFVYGIGLNKDTMKDLEIVDCDIKKVISIENKANFIMETKNSSNNELLIFSSGFYSPVEKKFLLRIKDYLDKKAPASVEYYHSGDFDLGGINIFVYIKNNIFEKLQPYKMGKDLFLKNLKFAEEITDKDYKNKIENLLNNKEYKEFHDVIKEIIKHNKVLEQEALLLN